MSFTFADELKDCPRRRRVVQLTKEEWLASLKQQVQLKKDASDQNTSPRGNQSPEPPPPTVSPVRQRPPAKPEIEERPPSPIFDQEPIRVAPDSPVFRQNVEQDQHIKERSPIRQRKKGDKVSAQAKKPIQPRKAAVRSRKTRPQDEPELPKQKRVSPELEKQKQMLSRVSKDCESMRRENSELKKQEKAKDNKMNLVLEKQKKRFSKVALDCETMKKENLEMKKKMQEQSKLISTLRKSLEVEKLPKLQVKPITKPKSRKTEKPKASKKSVEPSTPVKSKIEEIKPKMQESKPKPKQVEEMEVPEEMELPEDSSFLTEELDTNSTFVTLDSTLEYQTSFIPIGSSLPDIFLP